MVLIRHIQEVPTSLTNSTASLNSIDMFTNSTTNNSHFNGNSSSSSGNERTVFLGELEMNLTEKQLHDYFFIHNVSVLKVAKQPYSSYAHVTFSSSDVARHFLDAGSINLNGRLAHILPFNQLNNFDPNANLIIKNLESYLGEADVIKKFEEYGAILSCKLVRDERGESKCYAYLQ